MDLPESAGNEQRAMVSSLGCYEDSIYSATDDWNETVYDFTCQIVRTHGFSVGEKRKSTTHQVSDNHTYMPKFELYHKKKLPLITGSSGTLMSPFYHVVRKEGH